MYERPEMRRASLALGEALGAIASSSPSPAAAPRRRRSARRSASQAEAQEAFLDLGGKPGNDVGGLDGNGNGVACEALPGPYEGYATIGFNVRKGFLYGVATLPLHRERLPVPARQPLRPGNGAPGERLPRAPRSRQSDPRRRDRHGRRPEHRQDRLESGQIGPPVQAATTSPSRRESRLRRTGATSAPASTPGRPLLPAPKR